jgi:hypothetical protein
LVSFPFASFLDLALIRMSFVTSICGNEVLSLLRTSGVVVVLAGILGMKSPNFVGGVLVNSILERGLCCWIRA